MKANFFFHAFHRAFSKVAYAAAIATVLGMGTLQATEYAELRYAFGAPPLSQENGTAEIWVKPEIHFDEPVQDYYQFFVFRISAGKAWGDLGAVSVFWKPKSGLTVTASDGGERIDGFFSNVADTGKMRWEKGEWHHVALTWSEAKAALYVDGQLVTESELAAKLPLHDGKGFFIPGLGKSRIAVGEVCLTNRCLTAEEIRERRQSGLKPLPETIVFDDMAPTGATVGTRTLVNPHFSSVVEGRTPEKAALLLFKESE